MKAFITSHIQGVSRTATAPTDKAESLSRKLKSPLTMGIANQVPRFVTNF